MNIREAIISIIQKLKDKKIKTADLDAIIILEKALDKNDVFIISNPEYKLSTKEEKEIKRLTDIRAKLYPISYINGKKEFYLFEFYVNEDVLIPRPETEMLVDKVAELAKEFEKPIVADIGTGSGCIAISISKLIDAYVIASDISYKALRVAKKNATNLNADIKLIQADALSFLKKKIDIIVSNPPYIDEKDYQSLQKDVLFEPKEALICKNGTQILQTLIREAQNRCSYLVLEIGYNQEDFVSGFKGCIEVKKDLSGLPRMAVFKFN